MKKLIFYKLILIALALPTLAFAQIESLAAFKTRIAQSLTSINVQNRRAEFKSGESKLKLAIEEDLSLSKKAPSAAFELAKIYLQADRYQEAIFALEDGGLYFHAEFIRKTMESYLSTQPIRLEGEVGNGVSNSSFARVGNGLTVIAKPKDQRFSVESEVWSYQVDKLIGTNLIPVAVKRNIQGTSYSLHLFVADAQDSDLDFRDGGYKPKYSDIYILDYILGQLDRHGSNSLRTSGGRLFAIDHGRVYGSGIKEYDLRDNGLLPKANPSQRLRSHLANLDAKQFQTELTKYASRSVIEYLVEGISKLRENYQYSEKNGAIPLRPIQSVLNIMNAKVIPMPKPLSAAELKRIEAEAQRKNLEAYMQEASELTRLAAPRKIVYSKVDGVELSENGRKVFEFFGRHGQDVVQYRDLENLKIIIQLYDGGKIGFRDFRRLYASLLDTDLSDRFIKLSQSQFNEIGPLHKMLVDSDFREKYLDPDKNSVVFIKNYKAISRGLKLQLSCRFAYK